MLSGNTCAEWRWSQAEAEVVQQDKKSSEILATTPKSNFQIMATFQKICNLEKKSRVGLVFFFQDE